MPELPVKELRLPELHLPEISRQEIMRTLAEVRRPDLDRSDHDVPSEPILRRIRIDRAGMDAALAALPHLAVPTTQAARTLAGAASMFGFRRRRRVGRLGWGLLAGVAVSATIAGIVIARDRAARERIRVTARSVVERVSMVRTGQDDLLEVEPDLIAPEIDVEPKLESPVSEWAEPEPGTSTDDQPTEAPAVAPA